MRIVFVALISLLSTQVFAQDLIKLLDGHVSTCEDKYDVNLNAGRAIYRPVKLEKSQTSAKLTIEFVRCVEALGTFQFVRDFSVESRIVSSFADRTNKFLIERSLLKLVVTNEYVDSIDKKSFNKNEDGTYSVEFSTMAARYDTVPTGKESLIIFVQGLTKVTDLNRGELIDQGLDSFGAYRLIVK